MSRRPAIVRPAGKPVVTSAQVDKFKDDANRMIDDIMMLVINPLTDMVENTQSYMEDVEYDQWDERLGEWVKKTGTFEDQIYAYAHDHQEDDPEGSYLNIPARLDQLISQFKVVKSKLAESSAGVEYRYSRIVKAVPGSPSRERSASPSRMSSPSRSSGVSSRPSSPPMSPIKPARPSTNSPPPVRGTRMGSPPPARRMSSSRGSVSVPNGAEVIDIPEDPDLEITKLN